MSELPPASASSVSAESLQTCSDATQRLLRVLAQTRGFITGLADAQAYSQAPGDWPMGTIGAHVRHCLDHVSALLDGMEAGEIDYDQRERDTEVEHQLEVALFTLDGLMARVHAVGELPAAQAVQVRVLLAATAKPSTLPSTVVRELAFVLSHTIHHHAMMGLTAHALGQPIPAGFGLAPSTAAYRRKSAP